MTQEELIKKYDVPVPRYTSYPSVPHWNTPEFDIHHWMKSVERTFMETNDSKGISIYIHLPFCESLCTYCACNTRITKNHRVEEKYIRAVLQEWNRYLDIFQKRPVLREFHLGGGTPTFFTPGNLYELVSEILKSVDAHPLADFSFEGHPNNTLWEHLQKLSELNFRRVSFGVQDFDLKVQTAINRIQPFENVERVITQSRKFGYTSINLDLIYGLPYQTKESIEDTVQKVIDLLPERIAFYSYAHVPWIRPGQRGYEDADLPGDVLKRTLYETGRKLLLNAGYVDVGMDHFALPHDALAIAQSIGALHRNFMGYTNSSTNLLIGLGASAISDSTYAYAQNMKKAEDYEHQILAGNWAVFKGHVQSANDQITRRCILEIACKGELQSGLLREVMTKRISHGLKEMEADGIIESSANGIRITEIGRAFIRNICSVFDQTIKRGQEKKIFSQAI